MACVIDVRSTAVTQSSWAISCACILIAQVVCNEIIIIRINYQVVANTLNHGNCSHFSRALDLPLHMSAPS